jgi:hypothetical protein
MFAPKVIVPAAFVLCPSGVRMRPEAWSVVRGVGHVAAIAFGRVSSGFPFRSCRPAPLCPLESRVVGVGQFVHCNPIEPLANVRGVDRESRNICRPAGVATSFQIRSNSIEPSVPSLSRNLLSHDDRGSAGGDEAVEVGPEVSGVINSGAFACDRERLAGAASGLDGSVVRPPGEAEGVRPSADPGEEVTLGVPPKFISGNIDN